MPTKKQPITTHVLKILQEYSSESKRLSCAFVVRTLLEEYDVVCDRRRVGRAVDELKESGYDIIHHDRRFYLGERPFDDTELLLLIDTLHASSYLSSFQVTDLVRRLKKLGSSSLRLPPKKKSKKAPAVGDSFFYNLELLHEAISKNQRVSLMHNKYNIAKKLEPVYSEKKEVNPHNVLHHKGRYYLVCSRVDNGELRCYRIDKLSHLLLLDTVASAPPDKIDLSASDAFPYLFIGEAKEITLLTTRKYVDDLVDWFGDNVVLEKIPTNNKIRATVKVPEEAILYWLLQYAGKIEVLRPADLRKKVRANVLDLMRVYISSDFD